MAVSITQSTHVLMGHHETPAYEVRTAEDTKDIVFVEFGVGGDDGISTQRVVLSGGRRTLCDLFTELSNHALIAEVI